MTREEIESQYKIHPNGVIRDCGCFEGEMLYAPYFWDSALHSGGDESINGVEFFILSADDKLEFPELIGEYAVAIEQSEQGFVYCTVFGDKALYDASIARMEREESELAETEE